MKIGIYGGTFDPIHLGHMTAAQFAAEHLGLDRLYLIPAGIPPHKALSGSTAEAEHRLNMTKLAAGAMGKNVEALDIELRREGKSYTVDTLRAIRERHPEDELYFFMGTDMFLTFQKWYKPEEIASLCTLCAFGRSEADTEELFATQREYLERTLNARVVTIVLPQIVDISSTRLRQGLPKGEGRKYLHSAVYGYILREGLYGVERDLNALEMDDLRSVALSMLKPKRVPHVLGTEETAAALARRFGADETAARRCALLHDCTKALTREQHLALLRQYHIEPDEIELREEQLLHALSGAALAREVFGFSRAEADAIRYHTTGRAGMTTMEKIIYLADIIEPTRSFDGVEPLRELAKDGLDGALLESLERSIVRLKRDGGIIHPNSVLARDHLKGKQP